MSTRRVLKAVVVVALALLITARVGEAAMTERLHRVVITDPAGTGLDAYTMMVPAGWTFKGRVVWDIDNKAWPSTVMAHAGNKDNSEGVTAFPRSMFQWSPLMEQNRAQLGGKYMGCPIVRAPRSPAEALKAVVLDGFLRPTLENRYRIVGQQELPEAAAAYRRMSGAPSGGTIRAARLRIAYQTGGIAKDGEVVGQFVVVQGPSGQIWVLDQVWLVYAPHGRLNRELGRLHMLAMTLQITPRFQAATEDIQHTLVQQFFQNQQAFMNAVRSRTQMQQRMSEQQMAHWRANSEAQFKAVENWDRQVIRGVDNRVDPYSPGRVVPVPNTATHAWSNGAGDVIYTDSESYKPWKDHGGTWQEMPVAH